MSAIGLHDSDVRNRKRVRVAIVTNIPVPYREPVFEQLAQFADLEAHVFFCSGREPDRDWTLAAPRYPHTFLKEFFVTVAGRFIHSNFDVIAALHAFRPDVVVTTGFNPTHLMAYGFARLGGCAHIAMTDGTLASEQKLSGLHRTIRRVVFRGSQAFIGASEGSRLLYQTYGVTASRIFRSALCADNDRFKPSGSDSKDADLLFCGRLVDIKNPLFALEAAAGAARLIGRRVSIVFAGSGPCAAAIRSAAAKHRDLDVRMQGFVQPEQLPALYAGARIFLFPSRWDPWGVVANEAAASGLPVIVSHHAGVARELIRHERNGYVLPLNVPQWASAVATLLTDPQLYRSMSAAARLAAEEYTFASAASGIAEAVRLAVGWTGAIT